MKKQLLIVEDEFIEANNLQRILKRAGYGVLGISMSVPEALSQIRETRPDLVLLDIFLRGPQTGIHLAQTLKDMSIPFIYLSANSDSEILTQAKKTEPYGFLVKPFRDKDVLVMLDIAFHLHQQRLEISGLQQKTKSLPVSGKFDLGQIVGKSPQITRVLHLCKVVAPADTTVLILGENGTGKEGIVNAIHALSPRYNRPLIKLNCTTLPAALVESELFGHEKGAFTGALERRIGKFEQADGGTLFLDEIGEMPADLQVKLLRVLQEKEIERVGGKGSIKVDVRVITATNRNLEKEVAEGRFRMDLYYRLNVFPVVLPPLRDRAEDIPILIEHFISRFNEKMGKSIEGLAPKVHAALNTYHWPGNIRELEHMIERMVLLAEKNLIDSVELLGSFQTHAKPLMDDKLLTMEENDIEHIKRVLRASGGKLAGPRGAAEMLGVPYSTLASKIKRLGINID